MASRLRSFALSLRQRLWARPLVACLLSILAVALAGALDRHWRLAEPPEVSADSIEALLSIMASSMLVIAIFAAGAMVSAYASASNTASPRSFPLVVADDVSQNAYSMFVAAFIFGVVGLVALKNNSFGTVGRFVLFAETGLVFAGVILTFVRWVDQIARLGRLGNTIERAEEATAAAITARRRAPRLGGAPMAGLSAHAVAVESVEVGYVCGIDLAMLDELAGEQGLVIALEVLPGAFVGRGGALLRFDAGGAGTDTTLPARLRKAFRISRSREFEADPRFGLVVLSEIAGRALSPAVNDPGTAIDVIGRLVRLFDRWCHTLPDEPTAPPRHPRVRVPELAPRSLVEDAFTAIARDGAGSVEVCCRLLKGLRTIADSGDAALAEAARRQARDAEAMATARLPLPSQVERIRQLAAFAHD